MSLTSEGFIRPRLSEIKTQLDADLTAALGPVNTAPDSVIGQLSGIFAAAFDDAYEVLQNTYHSMYPRSAEGVSLDGAMEFVGLQRIPASATTVVANCYGTDGTLLPAGSLARAGDNAQYALGSDSIISKSKTSDIRIGVLSLENETTYQVIAGGVSVTYDSDVDATVEEIIAGLAAEFDPLVFVATADGTELRLQNVDLITGFPVSINSKLEILSIGSPATFTALELGVQEMPIGGLSNIDTPVAGWDSVSNVVIGETGRGVESDAELRLRHASGPEVIGSATVAAIKSRVLAETPLVTYVAVYENRTNETDAFLLPPHSIEVVVSGGVNQTVADKIWELKPAGIETYGNTTVSVSDVNGDGHDCKFSRASETLLWVRVTIGAIYSEESLSANAEQLIKDAVLAYGETLNIGSDVIAQRFYGPVYSATTGIGALTVEIATTALPEDVPVYSDTTIAVGRAQLPVFDVSRVTVVGLP